MAARCFSYGSPSSDSDQLSELMPRGGINARRTSSSRPMSIVHSLPASAVAMGWKAASGSPVGDGFRPPHLLSGSSYVSEQHSLNSFSIRNSSTRHQSIADRLKSVVFEQTGQAPLSTARGFLA